MRRTANDYLEILRADTRFKDMLLDSSVLNTARREGWSRKRKIGLSVQVKAAAAFRSHPHRAVTDAYLATAYGANMSDTQQVQRFKVALVVWLTEIWGDVCA